MIKNMRELFSDAVARVRRDQESELVYRILRQEYKQQIR